LPVTRTEHVPTPARSWPVQRSLQARCGDRHGVAGRGTTTVDHDRLAALQPGAQAAHLVTGSGLQVNLGPLQPRFERVQRYANRPNDLGL
jgi:hypothetical protein